MLIPCLILILSLITITDSQFPGVKAEISRKPISKRVLDRSYAHFSCMASGNPKPVFEWYKNGKQIKEQHPRYSLKSFPYGSILRIDPVKFKRDNGAVFNCIAENGQAKAESSATLHVSPADKPPPGFPKFSKIESRHSIVREVGYTLTLTCEASGSPTPFIDWLKGGIPVPRGRADRRVTITDAGHLQIVDLLEGDSGEYRCFTYNSVGARYSEKIGVFIKNRKFAPYFSIKPPAMKRVLPGSNFNISCVAVGQPMPIVRWKKGTQFVNIEGREGRNMLFVSDIKLSTNYTCVAESDLGTITRVTQVIVQQPPEAPKNILTSEIQSTAFMLKWDSVLQATSYLIRYRDRKNASSWSQINNITSNEHLISNLKPFTHYEVSVVSVSEIGSSKPSRVATIRTAESKPATPPISLTAKPISSTVVFVDWEEPLIPNGDIIGYKIRYSLDKTLTTYATQLERRSSATINNLLPYKLYRIQICAYNAIGDGPYSEIVEVRTTQGVPDQPQDITAVSETPNSIRISWKPPSAIKLVEKYTLYYSASNKTIEQRIEIKDHLEESYLLDDLEPNTAYKIFMTASSRVGESARSRALIVDTRAKRPGAAPSAVRAKSDDPETVRLEWTPPPPHLQHGVITHYRIHYEDTSDSSPIPTIRNLTYSLVKKDQPPYSYYVRGLKTWTRYRFQIAAATKQGIGPFSKPVYIKTAESVPGAPRDVAVTSINATTLKAKWKPPRPKDMNGLIVGYLIYIAKMRSNRPQKARRIDTLFNVTEFLLVELEADTQYQVTISGYTKAGDGDRSKPVKARTKHAVPTAPFMRATLQNEDRVKVFWKKPNRTYGTIKRYKLSFGVPFAIDGRVNKTKFIDPARTEFETKQLIRGMKYIFVLSATNNNIDYGDTATDSIKLPDATPTMGPLSLKVRALSRQRFQCTWKPPPLRHRNGDIVMYEIHFNKVSELNTYFINTTEKETHLNEAILPDLTMDTHYSFQIRAFTSAGAGIWSKPYIYKTPDQNILPGPSQIFHQILSRGRVRISWDYPNLSEVDGFQVFYSKNPVPNIDEWRKERIGAERSTILDNLEELAEYGVRIRTMGKKVEDGGISVLYKFKMKVFSQMEVPNFRAPRVTDETVVLRWDPPQQEDVEQYHLSYNGTRSYKDENDLQREIRDTRDKIYIEKPENSLRLINLRPAVLYRFVIRAKFTKNQFGPDNILMVRTNARVPSIVLAPRFKSREGDTLKLHLYPTSEQEGDISHYYLLVVPYEVSQSFATDGVKIPTLHNNIYIAGRFDSDKFPYEFTLGDGTYYGPYYNRPLSPDKSYRVFNRAYITEDKSRSSEYSEVLSLNPDLSVPYTVAKPKEDPPPTLTSQLSWIIPVCIILFLIILVIVILLIIRRKSFSNKKQPTPEVIASPAAASANNQQRFGNKMYDGSQNSTELRRPLLRSPSNNLNSSSLPISTELFAKHVQTMKEGENMLFSQEYEAIETNQGFTWEHSSKESNKPKNRYANVIAYDHSRVVLQTIDDAIDSDYINANFIVGYHKKLNTYISTQGPLPETFGDFWRMIWEQQGPIS